MKRQSGKVIHNPVIINKEETNKLKESEVVEINQLYSNKTKGKSKINLSK